MVRHEVAMNMRQLNPRRGRRTPGDVFAYLMPDGAFRFLRLIRNDARIGPITNVNLIYAYRFTRQSKDMPERSLFRKVDLITAPILTNNLGWVRGYFDFVGHLSLEQDEILPRHCFRSLVRPELVVDEYDKEVTGACRYQGELALASYKYIDLILSNALEIPHEYDEVNSQA